jgi:hypothetical protein
VLIESVERAVAGLLTSLKCECVTTFRSKRPRGCAVDAQLWSHPDEPTAHLVGLGRVTHTARPTTVASISLGDRSSTGKLAIYREIQTVSIEQLALILFT